MPPLLSQRYILLAGSLPLATAGILAAYLFLREDSPGCSVGSITVNGSRGEVTLRVSGDSIRFFGKHVDTDTLVRLVQNRIDAMQGKPEVHYSHNMTRSEYKTALAATLLAQYHDPQALPLLSALLDDPYYLMRGWAASALGKLGDPQGLPALARAMRSKKPHNGMLTPAMVAIGDPRAVDVMVETFDPPDGLECQWRLKAIERLTGHSTASLRAMSWPNMGKVKEPLETWWAQRRDDVLKNRIR